jgi:hypothetical protein
MEYRSWLEDVKNVKELAPWELPEDEELKLLGSRDEALKEKHSYKPTDPIPVSPEFEKFFRLGMHDSYITGDSRHEDYSVFLSCRYAEDFHLCLAQVLDVSVNHGEWPVEIIAKDAQLVRWMAPDKRGNLKECRPDWKYLNPNWDAKEWTVKSGSEYLHDNLDSQENRIQYVIKVAANFPNPGSTGYAYGLIDCAELVVNDQREKSLVAAWGKQIAPMWREAWERSHAH